MEEIQGLSEEKMLRIKRIESKQVSLQELYSWLMEPINVISTNELKYFDTVLNTFVEHPEGEILKLINHILNELYKKPPTVSLTSEFMSIAATTTDLFIQFVGENKGELTHVLDTMIHATSKFLRDSFIESLQTLFSKGVTETTVFIEHYFISNFKNAIVQQIVPSLPNNSLTLGKEYSDIAKTLIVNNLSNEFIPMSLIDFYGEHCENVDEEFISKINDALFSVPSPEHMELPIVQSDSVRAALMKLLQKIFLKECAAPELIKICINHIKDIEMKRVNGATFKKQPFVGLENLGCTCYINSLTQQLYMNPYFRNSIMNVKATDDTPYIKIYQKLFTELHETKVRYINTEEYVSSLKGEDGKELNPYVQMDTHEFLSSTLDTIEKELKSIEGQENIIDKCFSGTLVNQIVSKECEHISEHEEKTICEQMNIVVFGEKNKTSLAESLQSLVNGDELTGENKYFCEKCQKKVDAIRRTCIKTPPNTLILHLKRFEFDYETLQRIKINDRYEFPRELDLYPYCIEHINHPEKKDENGEYKFKLVGVLVHLGTLDSGHYYSYIKDQETGDEWFSFNDDLIDKFDINTLEESCFGGGQYSKHYSAYILFYQKEKPIMDIPPVKYLDDVKNDVIKNNLNLISNSVILSNTGMSDYLIQQMQYVNGEELTEFKDTTVLSNKMEEESNKQQERVDKLKKMDGERKYIDESLIKDLAKTCIHYQLTHETMLYGYSRTDLFQNELVTLLSKHQSIIDEILTEEITGETDDDLLQKTKMYITSVNASLTTINFFVRMFANGNKDLLTKYATLLIKFFSKSQRVGSSFRCLCHYIRLFCENPLCSDIFTKQIASGVGFIMCYTTLSVYSSQVKKLPDYSNLYILFMKSLAQNSQTLNKTIQNQVTSIKFKKETLNWIEKCKVSVDDLPLANALTELIIKTEPNIRESIINFVKDIQDSQNPLEPVLSMTYSELTKYIKFSNETEVQLFYNCLINEVHGYHFPSENICISNIIKNSILVNLHVKSTVRQILIQFIQNNEKEVYRYDYYIQLWQLLIIPKLLLEPNLFKFLYFNKKNYCSKLRYSVLTLDSALSSTQYIEEDLIKNLINLYQIILSLNNTPKPDYNLHSLSILTYHLAQKRPDLFNISILLKYSYPNYIETQIENKKINKEIYQNQSEILKYVITYICEHKREDLIKVIKDKSFDSLMNELLTNSTYDDESTNYLINMIFSNNEEEVLFDFIEHFTIASLVPIKERVELMVNLIFKDDESIKRFGNKHSINKLILLCSQKVCMPQILKILIPYLPIQKESLSICRDILDKFTNPNKENIHIIKSLLIKINNILETVDKNTNSITYFTAFITSTIIKVSKTEKFKEIEEEVFKLLTNFENKDGNFQQLVALLLISVSFIKEDFLKVLHFLLVKKKLPTKPENAEAIGNIICENPENIILRNEIVEYINSNNKSI
ncbi:ubiquitin specific protease, putative [Entamoeba dispar SAW760]|uniref:ubiquitinyl hydrolase 1 n=1 Tax=Entamoeba dispar (strain ATCC PRA-260 / SAW760) TaxID=370354 RepID=B0EFF4_ENTDS|nr:ubiquitin specific protease, putative [Entamoeba dispar SAW760]EDR26733.1 ubiquitin specific protease, putative [Entamoeba dispar SAW760]|eukprot:EDR26733.1 ubiquitin specific protease, putative [Entamoeba dispar SAW760]